MKLSTRTSGFTLLEIMLVVMIIAVLVGGAVVLFAPNLNFAGSTKAKADIQGITTQIMLYNAQSGTYPSTEQGIAALVQKPSTEPVPRSWSQSYSSLPLDPWQQPYNYQCPGTHNPASFDVWSNGPDKQSGTSDDIGNWGQQ
jgi:general secretion pathway protein G